MGTTLCSACARPITRHDALCPNAARLAAQWPKICACGRVYCGDPVSAAMVIAHHWRAQPFAYIQKDAFATFEARQCSCGSTLMVITEIHDLKEE